MKSLMKTRAARAFALILFAALLCIGANFLAFAIDTEDMREHAWQGCLMLGEQQGTPQTVGGFLSAQLDNFTSVLILKTAGYVGPEDLKEKAFGGFRVDMPTADGQSDWDAFCTYEFGEHSPTGGGMSYSRYWHGYTLPLRALLCVLDMANIQMLLYFAQLALFIYVLHLMGKRGLGQLIPGFFLSYFLLMPFSVSICLQYAPVSMLMLSACVCVLKWDEQIHRVVSLPAFFALLGLLTNYFDLLTFPLVSLGFPLILLLALRMQLGDSGKALFFLTVCCGLAWAFGYGGMWALKWIINGFVFGWHMLHGVLTQIDLRTSDNGGTLSRVAVALENLDVILAKKSYLLLIGAAGLVTLAHAAKSAVKARGVHFDWRALNLLLPIVAVCLLYIAMTNHANDHTYFTYRSMTVAVLCVFSFLSYALRAKDGDAP